MEEIMVILLARGTSELALLVALVPIVPASQADRAHVEFLANVQHLFLRLGDEVLAGNGLVALDLADGAGALGRVARLALTLLLGPGLPGVAAARRRGSSCRRRLALRLR